MGMDRAGGSSRGRSSRRLSSVLPFAFSGGRRGKEAMVARAKAFTCMGMLLGAALSPWPAQASVPVALVTEAAALSAPAQVESRPTKAHSALNAGIEMQRRGEYVNAAAMFKEALARQTDLTPAELQDLKNRMAANDAALKARQDGDTQ